MQSTLLLAGLLLPAANLAPTKFTGTIKEEQSGTGIPHVAIRIPAPGEGYDTHNKSAFQLTTGHQLPKSPGNLRDRAVIVPA